jgi:hypothetical protein
LWEVQIAGAMIELLFGSGGLLLDADTDTWTSRSVVTYFSENVVVFSHIGFTSHHLLALFSCLLPTFPVWLPR